MVVILAVHFILSNLSGNLLPSTGFEAGMADGGKVVAERVGVGSGVIELVVVGEVFA